MTSQTNRTSSECGEGIVIVVEFIGSRGCSPEMMGMRVYIRGGDGGFRDDVEGGRQFEEIRKIAGTESELEGARLFGWVGEDVDIEGDEVRW